MIYLSNSFNINTNKYSRNANKSFNLTLSNHFLMNLFMALANWIMRFTKMIDIICFV